MCKMKAKCFRDAIYQPTNHFHQHCTINQVSFSSSCLSCLCHSCHFVRTSFTQLRQTHRVRPEEHSCAGCRHSYRDRGDFSASDPQVRWTRVWEVRRLKNGGWLENIRLPRKIEMLILSMREFFHLICTFLPIFQTLCILSLFFTPSHSSNRISIA